MSFLKPYTALPGSQRHFKTVVRGFTSKHMRTSVVYLFLLSALVACVSTLLAQDSGANSGKDRVTAAFGKIQPLYGVRRVGPPASTFPAPSPVSQLNVVIGDAVKAGDSLAQLEIYPRLEATWKVADARANLARTRLEGVRNGPYPAQLAGAQAEVVRLEAEYSHAQAQLKRSEALRPENAVSQVELESTRTRESSLKQALESARQSVQRLQLSHQTDLALAKAELQVATAQAEQARLEMEQGIVRAPVDGVIVEIHAHPGEAPGAGGVVELAPTPLWIRCEVFEPEVSKLKLGQSAEITGDLISGTLTGAVDRIGKRVGKNQIFGHDPASAADLRVVEVWVKTDEPLPMWIDAQVRVLFQK